MQRVVLVLSLFYCGSDSLKAPYMVEGRLSCKMELTHTSDRSYFSQEADRGDLSVVSLGSRSLVFTADEALQFLRSVLTTHHVELLSVRLSSLEEAGDFFFSLHFAGPRLGGLSLIDEAGDETSTSRADVVGEFLLAIASHARRVKVELLCVCYRVESLTSLLALSQQFDLEMKRLCSQRSPQEVTGACSESNNLYLRMDEGGIGLSWGLLRLSRNVLTKLEVSQFDVARAGDLQNVLESAPLLDRITFSGTVFRRELLVPIIAGIQARSGSLKITCWECDWIVDASSEASFVASVPTTVRVNIRRAEARLRERFFRAILDMDNVRKLVVDSDTKLGLRASFDRRVVRISANSKPRRKLGSTTSNSHSCSCNETEDVASIAKALLACANTTTLRIDGCYWKRPNRKVKVLLSTCMNLEVAHLQCEHAIPGILNAEEEGLQREFQGFPSVSWSKSVQAVHVNGSLLKMADMVHLLLYSPYLEELHFVDYFFPDRICSESDAKELAQACCQNVSVRAMWLQGDMAPYRLYRTLTANMVNSLTRLKLEAWCDGGAVGQLLRHSKNLRELSIYNVVLAATDCLCIKGGLRVNYSLQSLELVSCDIPVASQALVVDMIQACDSLEGVRVIDSAVYLRDIRGGDAVFDPLLTTTVGRMLEQSSFLLYLDLSSLVLGVDGMHELARGVATHPSLTSLALTMAMTSDFFEQGLSQNTILRNLKLKLSPRKIAAFEMPPWDWYIKESRFSPLARYIKDNRSVVSMKLELADLWYRHSSSVNWDLSELWEALAFNVSLNEFDLLCAGTKKLQEDTAGQMAFMLRRLRRLRSLRITSGFSHYADLLKRLLRPLKRNMTLTDFVLRDLSLYNHADFHIGFFTKLKRIESRNEKISRLEDEVGGMPKVWPRAFQLILRNDHTGPSILFRFLSSRSVRLELLPFVVS